MVWGSADKILIEQGGKKKLKKKEKQINISGDKKCYLQTMNGGR